MTFFFQYLKGLRRVFFAEALFALLFIASFLLYRLPLGAVLYPLLLCGFVGVVLLAFDFSRVWREHTCLQRMKTIADATVGPFPPCRRTADADYQALVSLLCAEHSQYKIKTDGKYEDMVNYYTVWAHQIKTPLAAMRLHLQNEDSPLSRQLMLNLHRVEQYVEMVLTFLRLNTESTDYVIREQDLDGIVRQAVRKFSAEFIARRLSLVYEPLHVQVITDEKWLSFVIEQLLSNALKYTPSGSISITLEADSTLCIRDTGLGIAPEDLPRIFENGYTGCHGRTDKRASGIGLYLCKRICDNLGHTISVQSEVDVGTTVSLRLARQRLVLE